MKWLILLGLISLGAAGEPEKPKPQEQPMKRFLALGDSYTIGESVEPAQRWPMQLAGALRDSGVKIDDPQIIATTGWTTDELNAAIDKTNPRGPFDLVTLLIGVNNQYRGRDVENFRKEFAALLDRAIGFAGGKPARVIVVSIPDWGVMPFAEGRDRATIAREIDAYNAVCRAEADKRKAAFIDITPISRQATTGPSLGAPDGLHPSGEQYQLWTSQILPRAQEALNP